MIRNFKKDLSQVAEDLRDSNDLVEIPENEVIKPLNDERPLRKDLMVSSLEGGNALSIVDAASGGEGRRMGILVTILFVMSSTQLLYLNVATFLPPYRLRHHSALSDT